MKFSLKSVKEAAVIPIAGDETILAYSVKDLYLFNALYREWKLRYL